MRLLNPRAMARHALRFGCLAGVAAVLLAACVGPRPAAPPTSTGPYKIGSPYQVNGTWYHPQVDYGYDAVGVASWYGPGFHGRQTANGETYDENALTAAHPSLPMPSLVRVTNLDNGRAVVVRINDRGPFAHGRLIDLSRRGAEELGFVNLGTARVRVQILADESRAMAPLAHRTSAEAPLPAIAVPLGAVEVAPLDDTPPGRPVAVEEITVAAVPATAPLAAQAPAAAAPMAVAPQATAVHMAVAAQVSAATVPVAVAPETPVAESADAAPGREWQQSRPSKIYVQAGSFSVYGNATRLRARLAPIAPAAISSATIDGSLYYRVRLGPLETVEQADEVLASVIGSGQPGAHIVIDQ